MGTRTFRQKAMGYGTTPVNITAKINNNVVFTGNIITDINPPPLLPDFSIDLGDPVFSWTHDDINFQGSFDMEIMVNNAASDDCFVYITDTQANYILTYDGNMTHYFGDDVFGSFYYTTVDDPEDLPPWIATDPTDNVTIDGVPTLPHPTRNYPGQCYFTLRPQQVLHCTVNVLSGGEIPPAYNNTMEYVYGNRVSYLNEIFGAKKNTIGNLPTDTNYWVLLGVIG